MIINKAELEAVAVKPSQYPPEDLAEIAFAGRSNVGKSSLLNLLVNRKKLAYVSSTPGKTRTINFYRINDNFRIVDLPGYGYAKIPKKVSEQWGEMIEGYLKMRPNIIKVIQLVDIRHEPSIMGLEGKASNEYWRAVKYFIPNNIGFEKRIKKPTDLLNSMLNYGYAILASEITKSILLIGLDPYCGFLHYDIYEPDLYSELHL